MTELDDPSEPTVQDVQELEKQVETLNEELGNSTVVTQTPGMHDISWWVKWLAAIIGIFGAIATAAELYPWNVVLGFISLVGWGYVGVLWNDRALIIMNVFLAGVYCLNLVNQIKVYYAN